MRRPGLLAPVSLASMLCCSHAHAEVLFAGGCASSYSVQFILRQDFTDVPALGCGDADQLPLALGARASYLYDDIHRASSLSLDGLAALNIRYTVPGLEASVPRFSFGPFVQGAGMETVSSSSSPVGTSGSVTSGGFVQFFNNNVLPTKFRFRGGELLDTTGVQDGSAVGELIPAFSFRDVEQLTGTTFLPDSFTHFLFGGQYALSHLAGNDSALGKLYLNFNPEVEAQYDSYQGGPRTYALFSRNLEAMRLGPLLVLKLYGFDGLAEAGTPLADQLKKIVVSFSYHADWDVMSRNRYYLYQPSLIYNLNKAGTYAVTTTYSTGDSETSGNRARQLKVAFSAKF